MGHLIFTRQGTEVVVPSKLTGKLWTTAQVKIRRAERYAAKQAKDPYMPDVDSIERKVGDQLVPALRHHDIEVTVQRITPETAAEWLERNDKNPRRMRPAVAQRYAEDVRAGRWAFPTSFIGFSPDGDLNNGQHTLSACVRGGQPIDTLVIYNVPEDAVAAMDRGLRRSLADTLHGQGMPRPVDLQAVIKLCWRWENGWLENRKVTPTDVQALDWLEANPGVVDATVATVPVQRKARLKKSIMGAVFYRAMLIDPDAAATFLDQLLTGAGLEEGSPALKLREYGVTSQVRKDRQTYDLAVAVKAWNAHVTGGRIYTLRWTREGVNRERFPEMVNVEGEPCRFDGKTKTAAENQLYEESDA